MASIPRRGPVRRTVLAVALTALAAPVVTAPAAAAAQAGTQVTAADQATILAAHNTARQEVGVAPLAWDDMLASDAQAWVDFLVADRGGRLDHGSAADPLSGGAKGQGENLNGGGAPGNMAAGWYAEKAKFDAANPKTIGPSDDWVNWGHYSQMVWSTTTRLGCGTAVGGPFGTVNSCRYSPAGNFSGEEPFTPGMPGGVPPDTPPAGAEPNMTPEGTTPDDTAPDGTAPDDTTGDGATDGAPVDEVPPDDGTDGG